MSEPNRYQQERCEDFDPPSPLDRMRQENAELRERLVSVERQCEGLREALERAVDNASDTTRWLKSACGALAACEPKGAEV